MVCCFYSIYRKFEETECLLDQLKIQEDGINTVSHTTPVKNLTERSFSAEPTNGNITTNSRLPSTDTRDIVVGVASKKPKDEAVIIEELQVANSHLRKMVDSLFYELSSCQRENLELKARVRYLENLHGKVLIQQPSRPLMQSQSAQPSPSHGFKTFKPDLTPVRVPVRLGPPAQFATSSSVNSNR